MSVSAQTWATICTENMSLLVAKRSLQSARASLLMEFGLVEEDPDG